MLEGLTVSVVFAALGADLPVLAQDAAEPVLLFALPHTENDKTLALIDEGPAPIPILAVSPVRLNELFAVHATSLSNLTSPDGELPEACPSSPRQEKQDDELLLETILAMPAKKMRMWSLECPRRHNRAPGSVDKPANAIGVVGMSRY